MERNATGKNNAAAVIAAVLLTLAGGTLLGYSLYMLPGAPVYGFPWAFAGAVLSFVLLSAAGWCLNLLVRRRRDKYFSYGQNGHDGAFMLGIFVIIAGVLLLGFNNGALPDVWRRVFFSWQMLLIAVGTTELARGRFWGGGIFLSVGGFLIIRRLAPVYPEIAASGAWVSYWPVLLILLGILIVCGMVFSPCRSRCGCRRDRGARPAGRNNGCGHRPDSSTSGVVDISVVFGGSEQVYLDPVFQGGTIRTVFGGVVLDLRRTGLGEGDTILHVDALFGGVEIYVPEGWHVDIRNESVFGGFNDKRLHSERTAYDDGRKLIVRACNVFGGGEIK